MVPKHVADVTNGVSQRLDDTFM